MPSARFGADRLNGTYDIAVVGSGFGGSLLAMIAHQLGRSIILLERNKHPRFAIGESSTPLSNILLENLTTRYDLLNLTPLSKWGSWQQANPQIACGLKRGFTFYHHSFGAPYAPDPEHHHQLLVAASPRDAIADTHWYRAEVDHFFVQQAQQIGVPYLDEINLRGVTESDSDIRVTGRRGSEEVSIGANFLVDATGPRGFLHRALEIPELELPDFPATQALFSHFTGVGQIADGVLAEPAHKPPYPVDDAAVHHIFEGGWIWVLKFNNGITSAGVAAADALAERLRFSEGEPAWRRLLDLLPAVKEQFAAAQANRPFTHMPRVSFRSKDIAGKRWALLPSAAGFVETPAPPRPRTRRCSPIAGHAARRPSRRERDRRLGGARQRQHLPLARQLLPQLGAAYRADGRFKAIFDTVGHNPYPYTSSERPWTRHPTSTMVAEGDYDKLMAVLQDAFGGTSQPIRGQGHVSIWYMEQGFQTTIDPSKASAYTGTETDGRALPPSPAGRLRRAATALRPTRRRSSPTRSRSPTASRR